MNVIVVKPNIWKGAASQRWYCSVLCVDGYLGRGATPKEAYEDWARNAAFPQQVYA